MKKAICLLALVVSLTAIAQVPNTISYRAVVYDQDGAVLKNQEIKVELSIQNSEDFASSEILYKETHNVTTNTNGGFHLQIGGGKSEKGMNTLEDAIKEAGDKFLSIQVYDSTGNLLSNGSSQFNAVPYALVAKELARVPSISAPEYIEVLDNISALQLHTGYQDGDIVYLKGHTNRNDGGGGHFFYDSGFCKT